MTPQQFRAIRLRLNMTQADLAQLLGYSMPLTISQFERKTNPKPVPRHLDLLMEALDTGFWPKDWPQKVTDHEVASQLDKGTDARRHE